MAIAICLLYGDYHGIALAVADSAGPMRLATSSPSTRTPLGSSSSLISRPASCAFASRSPDALELPLRGPQTCHVYCVGVLSLSVEVCT
ncbi:hypothetical protein CaCOL14_011341 [Colletotrichum acutatum]